MDVCRWPRTIEQKLTVEQQLSEMILSLVVDVVYSGTNSFFMGGGKKKRSGTFVLTGLTAMIYCGYCGVYFHMDSGLLLFCVSVCAYSTVPHVFERGDSFIFFFFFSFLAKLLF